MTAIRRFTRQRIGPVRTDLTHPAETARRNAHLRTTQTGNPAVQGIGAERIVVRLSKVDDWNHQIGHLIRCHHQLTLLPDSAGDLEHFIVDVVGEVAAAENQIQRALDLDAVHIDRDRRVRADPFLFESGCVKHDVHVGDGLNLLHDLAERHLVFVQRDAFG